MAYALDQSKLWTGVFYKDVRPTFADRWNDIGKRAGQYRDLNQLFDHFR
jgi:hypothetical protein